jgi:hypothetical protein
MDCRDCPFQDRPTRRRQEPPQHKGDGWDALAFFMFFLMFLAAIARIG